MISLISTDYVRRTKVVACHKTRMASQLTRLSSLLLQMRAKVLGVLSYTIYGSMVKIVIKKKSLQLVYPYIKYIYISHGQTIHSIT